MNIGSVNWMHARVWDSSKMFLAVIMIGNDATIMIICAISIADIINTIMTMIANMAHDLSLSLSLPIYIYIYIYIHIIIILIIILLLIIIIVILIIMIVIIMTIYIYI